MSTVSELFPAGGGDNTIDMVASGTLSNGARVILKSDGKVEVVNISGTPVSESIPAGSEVVYNSTINYYPTRSAYDRDKIVLVYSDYSNSSYGTAIVGTVAGTSISFGSAVVFYSAGSDKPTIDFDRNNAGKCIVSFRGTSDQGQAIVGTVSGTTISFGSPTFFRTSMGESHIKFDPNTSNQFVIAYNKGSYLTGAVVGTISGTSLSFGSESTFSSSQYTGALELTMDTETTGSFVVTYQDASNSYDGTAVAASMSGTSITFGSTVVFNSNNAYNVTSGFISGTASKFVVACKDSSVGVSYIGTVSGTTISFGSVTNFVSSGYPSAIRLSFDPNTAGKFIIYYKNSSGYPVIKVGTVSGSVISYGTENVLNTITVDAEISSLAFDANTAGKFITSYNDTSSNYGRAIVGQIAATVQATNLTSTNLLGIATKAVADGATVPIETLGGYVDNQTGLTIGSDYYVASDGSLTTTSTDNVSIGKAISATEINMRDYV